MDTLHIIPGLTFDLTSLVSVERLPTQDFKLSLEHGVAHSVRLTDAEYQQLITAWRQVVTGRNASNDLLNPSRAWQATPIQPPSSSTDNQGGFGQGFHFGTANWLTPAFSPEGGTDQMV